MDVDTLPNPEKMLSIGWSWPAEVGETVISVASTRPGWLCGWSSASRNLWCTLWNVSARYRTFDELVKTSFKIKVWSKFYISGGCLSEYVWKITFHEIMTGIGNYIGQLFFLPIYIIFQWFEWFKQGLKSMKPVTLNMAWLTLICLIGSNNTCLCKLSGCLYFALYISSWK